MEPSANNVLHHEVLDDCIDLLGSGELERIKLKIEIECDVTMDLSCDKRISVRKALNTDMAEWTFKESKKLICMVGKRKLSKPVIDVQFESESNDRGIS